MIHWVGANEIKEGASLLFMQRKNAPVVAATHAYKNHGKRE